MRSTPFKVFLVAIAIFMFVPVWASKMVSNNSPINIASADTSGGFKPIKEPIPIIVRPINDDNHRSLVPISATYFDGSIELDFYSNLGTLYIVVVNSSTGERWSEYVETSEGYATIDISTAYYTGTYTINMYTQSSTYYTGTFVVE